MVKRGVWALVTAVLVVTMLLAACQPAATTETEGTTVTGKETTPTTTTPTTTTPTTTTPTTTEPKVDYSTTPYYGGEGVFYAGSLIARWDPSQLGHRPGQATAYLETLTQGDWAKGPQGTNDFAWSNQTVPDTCLTGLLAESWEMVDDYTIIYYLRKGVRYASNDPTVPGSGREMVAADLVAASERVQLEPRSVVYRGEEGRDNKNWVEMTALDKYTVQVVTPTPILSIGAGNVSPALAYPPEAVAAYGDLEDWRHAIGTGPWILTDFVPDSSHSYRKNPNYWQSDPLRPEYKMPYMDAYRVIIIPDTATQMSAIATHKVLTYGTDYEKGQLLMESNPELNWTDRPSNYNVVIFFRNDIEPFNDIRVRKALAIAIDRQAILDGLMRGVGTMNAWPVWESVGYDTYVPLEDLPADIAELYDYDPAKAKQYLTDAGYPSGFQVELLSPQVESYIDRATIVKTFWDAIGVKTTINVIEAGTFYNQLYGKNYDQTAIVAWGNSSQGSVLGWCWRTDILYNYGGVSDPVIDEAWDTTRITIDPVERAAVFREAYLYGMEKAWEICLPQPIDYVFWQPYMHGYAGEYSTNIAEHVWLDLDLWKELTGR